MVEHPGVGQNPQYCRQPADSFFDETPEDIAEAKRIRAACAVSASVAPSTVDPVADGRVRRAYRGRAPQPYGLAANRSTGAHERRDTAAIRGLGREASNAPEAVRDGCGVCAASQARCGGV